MKVDARGTLTAADTMAVALALTIGVASALALSVVVLPELLRLARRRLLAQKRQVRPTLGNSRPQDFASLPTSTVPSTRGTSSTS